MRSCSDRSARTWLERLESRHLLSGGGSPDPTYGTAGVGRLGVVAPADNTFGDLAVTADGKTVVAADSWAQASDGVLLRYLPNGQLDPTFGTGGVVRYGTAAAQHVLPQADGSLIVLPQGVPTGPRLVRFTSTGQLDTAWTGPSPAALVGADRWVADAGNGRLLLATAKGVALVKSDGTLDTTFGAGGSGMITFPSNTPDFVTFGVYSATLDSAGRVLIIGDRTDVHAGTQQYELRRYLPNGQLDASFDGDGMRTLSPTIATYSSGEISVLPGDKLLVTTNTSGKVFRFNADGSPDTTFGSQGVAVVAGATALYHPRALPDGRVLVGGDNGTNFTSTSGILIARLTANGQPDPTFDGDGVRDGFWSSTWLPWTGGVYGVRPDGEIILGGSVTAGTGDSGVTRDVVLYGLTANGATDPAFGDAATPGQTSTDVPHSLPLTATRSAVDGSGRVVLTGYPSSGVQSNMLVGRLDASGQPDAAFGTSGLVTADGNVHQEWSADSAVQPDGKIVVVGKASFVYWPQGFTSDQLMIARFFPDGKLDPSFGKNGVVVDPFGSHCFFSRVVLQADGRIVVGGTSISSTSGTSEPAVVRLMGDGSIDQSFGTGGIRYAAGPGSSSGFGDLALAPDGGILLGGTTYLTGALGSSDVARYVARIRPSDGAIDNSFATNGIALLQAPEPSETLLRLLPDGTTGAIYAAGTATDSSSRFLLTKLTAGGTPDPAFGTGGTASVSLGTSQRLAAADRLPGGGFVVVGQSRPANGNYDALVLRLAPDGTPQPGFGAGGFVAVDLGTNGDTATDVHALPDGRVMVTGSVSNATGTSDWYATRLDISTAPQVQSVTVNNGASQRSMVTSLTVTFDQPVAVQGSAFSLAGRNGAGLGTTVSAANPSGDGKTWVLTFSGSPVRAGSLADGVYDLTVNASAVHSASAAATQMGGDSRFAFHRLYGDADGDGDVDALDLFQFQRTLNKHPTEAGYLGYLDYDGNGIVDALDLFQVRGRLAVTYKGY